MEPTPVNGNKKHGRHEWNLHRVMAIKNSPEGNPIPVNGNKEQDRQMEPTPVNGNKEQDSPEGNPILTHI